MFDTLTGGRPDGAWEDRDGEVSSDSSIRSFAALDQAVDQRAEPSRPSGRPRGRRRGHVRPAARAGVRPGRRPPAGRRRRRPSPGSRREPTTGPAPSGQPGSPSARRRRSRWPPWAARASWRSSGPRTHGPVVRGSPTGSGAGWPDRATLAEVDLFVMVNDIMSHWASMNQSLLNPVHLPGRRPHRLLGHPGAARPGGPAGGHLPGRRPAEPGAVPGGRDPAPSWTTSCGTPGPCSTPPPRATRRCGPGSPRVTGLDPTRLSPTARNRPSTWACGPPWRSVTPSPADPGYAGAVQALRLSGGRLVGLPTDADGLGVDALEELLEAGLRPRLVYVSPTSTTRPAPPLSAARARLRPAGWPTTTDSSSSRTTPTVPSASAGKPRLRWHPDRSGGVDRDHLQVLFPGLRVGWVVGPPELTRSLALVKQAVDLHTATLSQRLAHGLLARSDFLARAPDDPADPPITPAGPKSCTTPWRPLSATPSELRRPEGGLFLWTRLRGHRVDTATRLADAIAGRCRLRPPGRPSR